MQRVLALIGALALGGVGVFLWLTTPWEIAFPDFTDTEVELALPDEARIVAVEPITLDCRARVYAEVPIEGTREHSAFGQVYRTDSIEMTAYGDVDTCVSGFSTRVIRHPDGTTEVIIPGESIEFVRPRVDTVATADTVTIDKGLVGKLTDVAPWVSDDLGLTPMAYAHAQNVIGSSECMQAAYELTEQMLIDAYTEQFELQGADPDSLSVIIDGTPDFGDPTVVEWAEGVFMTEDGEALSCTPAAGLGTVADRG